MKDGGRCLTWSLVGTVQAECLLPAGHGGMHNYPVCPEKPRCPHKLIGHDLTRDTIHCDTCGRDWT